MFRQLAVVLSLASTLTLPAVAQDSSSKDKSLDIRSSVGDLHVGPDADAKKIGVPLYPGARPKSKKDSDHDQANLSILTEEFGMNLLVASYVSDDQPAKIIDFYRDKLKKFGKVLECHSQKRGVNMDSHDEDKDSGKNKELKCDEDSGPVTELKVGTEDNQHIVAVEPGDASKGTTFALVYLRTRGKRGEI